MKKIFVLSLFFCVISINSQIKDSLKNIQEVKLTFKKKMIERKSDRIVFNLENSIASQGMNGIEALSNTPLLKFNENTNSFSVVGKSSVSIMVNGKLLNLKGNDLVNYLSALQSNQISKIEVITTPPSKYEAEGNSGLINIILKKNTKPGWNGSASSTFIQRTYPSFNENLNLNYQNKNITTSLNLNFYKYGKKASENYSILGFNNFSISKSKRHDFGNGFSPNFSFNYQINKNQDLGFIYNRGFGTRNMDIQNVSEISSLNENLNLLTGTEHREKNPTNSLNLYYDIKLDSLGKKLSFNSNFYNQNSATEVNFETKNSIDNSSQIVKTLSKISPEIFSIQSDLELPLSWGTLEVGLKYNQFKNETNLQYFNLQNSSFEKNIMRSNRFQYKERNYASYFSFNKKWDEKWESKIGLRYEYTETEGFTPETQIQSNNNYGKFFPTLSLGFTPNTRHSFSASYSKRINRPSLENLNPFRWYSNPYEYGSGNPALQPSYISNLELGYTYKNKLSASIYHLNLKNGFGQISYLNGIYQIGTYLNYYDNNFFGLNISYNDQILKFWETNLSFNANLQNSKVYNITAEAQNGKAIYYSINNTFTLNKKKTLSLFVNYDQSFPYKNSNAYFKNFSDLSSGLKLSLLEKKLQINATVTNIFAQKYSGEMYFSDNTQYFNNYWDGRSFRLSVTYNFGNKTLKTKKKDINFEEKNRVSE